MALSALQRFCAPEGRSSRVTWQKALVVCALLALMAGLLMPAAYVTLERGRPPMPVSGAVVMVTSKPYYASNGLLILGPLLAWAVRQFRRPHVQRVVVCCYVASLAFVAAAPTVVRHTDPMLLQHGAVRAAAEMLPAPGFYAWIASHVLMTLALALPVWGAAAADRDARRELRELHDKWVRGAEPGDAVRTFDDDEPVDATADFPTGSVDPFADGASTDHADATPPKA